MIEEQNKPLFRELPKDQDGIILPFETKKGRYNIIRPGQPLGIIRFTELQKMKLVFGTARTVAALVEALRGIQKVLGADKSFADIRTEAILGINSILQGLIDTSKQRFDYGLYLCTLFIYRDGHDPKQWDMATAESYIEDWAAEGLSELDFFSFALLALGELRRHIQEVKEQEAAREAVLSGFIL